VVLVPTISLRRVEYYYVVSSIVWCYVNFSYTLFVCIATLSSEDTCHLKSKLVPGISSARQVVPLITSFTTHVLINHNDLHMLILMGPNRLP
jgi:Na+/H+ antiporter NhaD/arsenite permease-like protein